MSIYPDLESFQRLAAEHELVPVYRRIASDSITPVLAFFRLQKSLEDGPCSAACLFESVIGGEKVGRYSFLASNPTMNISASGNKVSITTADGIEEVTSDNPLDELRERVQGVRVAHP